MNGNDIADQGHFPFGEAWYLGSAGTKWQFTTHERDAESGNDYAKARFNVSRLGRFSSPDPLSGSAGDPQSLNRYSYVRNMPVVAIDPTGKFCLPTVSIPEDDDGAVWSAHPFWRMRFGLPNIPDCNEDCDPIYVGCYCYFIGDCVGLGGGGGGGPNCDPETGACPPPTPVLPPPEPKCFAQLKYRPLRGPLGKLEIHHAFWWVQDGSGSRYILSGGSSNPSGLGGYLLLWDSPEDIPYYSLDKTSAPLAWKVKGDLDVCSAVVSMHWAAYTFPQYTFPYDATGQVFWNSNSMAYTLGVYKAGFLFITPPPRSPGWGKVVPW